MVSSKRFLMFLQKEGSGIVVETIDSGHWKKLKEAAKSGEKVPAKEVIQLFKFKLY